MRASGKRMDRVVHSELTNETSGALGIQSINGGFNVYETNQQPKPEFNVEIYSVNR